MKKMKKWKNKRLLTRSLIIDTDSNLANYYNYIKLELLYSKKYWKCYATNTDSKDRIARGHKSFKYEVFTALFNTTINNL